MTPLRWLAEGDWAAAQLSDLENLDGTLALAPASTPRTQSGTSFLRHGVAVLASGIPSEAQRRSSTDGQWRRVFVRLAAPITGNAWFQVWTRVETGGVIPTAPDPATALAADAPVPSPAGIWRVAAVNAIDVRVLCTEPGNLWLAIELGGDGSSSPQIVDIRLDAGDDGPVTDLPVSYRTLDIDPKMGSPLAVDTGDGFAGRYLGLIGAELRQTASLLEELPASLSPSVAPDRTDAPWLERLAAWVALDPDALPASPGARRETVSTAVTRHGWRGTRRGLVDQVRRETGLTVEVIEPLQDVVIWRLNEELATSSLGLTTGLLEGYPGPPILDVSACLDASMLISRADDGLPVHGHRAHRICVHVPGGSAADVAAVDLVVQRERPAHVLARTCAVHHETDMWTVVGEATLPGPGTTGLANDVAFDTRIDGPGVRLGTARLSDDTQTNESKGTAK